MPTSSRITKVIFAIAVSAIVLGAAGLVFGLIAYANYNQVELHPEALQAEIQEKSDNQQQRQPLRENILEPAFPTISAEQRQLLTGNLSVYLLPLPSGYLDSGAIVNNVSTRILPNITASYYYPTLGASRQGQYANENVILTEQIILENDELNANRDRFKVGGTAEMTVFKKPAETVAFHIHPAVKKPDGTSVAINEIPEDWSFGNGVTCCGFSLRDGTDIRALIIVVDQAYDSLVMEKYPSIKIATNSTTSE